MKEHEEKLIKILKFANTIIAYNNLTEKAINEIAHNYAKYLSTVMPEEYLGQAFRLASTEIKGGIPNALHIEKVYNENLKREYLLKVANEQQKKREESLIGMEKADPEDIKRIISEVCERLKL